jgi:hypothetical protein
MAIAFASPEELLGAILAMAESAPSDFAGFETSLDFTRQLSSQSKSEISI